jgi:hypothetical protein
MLGLYTPAGIFIFTHPPSSSSSPSLSSSSNAEAQKYCSLVCVYFGLERLSKHHQQQPAQAEELKAEKNTIFHS